MKKVTSLLILFFSINFIACTTDETIDRAIFEEEQKDPTASNPDEEDDIDDKKEEEIIEDVIVTATETCFIQDIELVSGEITKINCLLDLQGEKVTIPDNVTLEFDGGDIFNGTLDFVSEGKIDGKLLNSSLDIEGGVQLISNDFGFIPSRWDIAEGDVEVDKAFNNHIMIQKAIDLVKKLTPKSVFSETFFQINRMDAYFESDTSPDFGLHVIQIPSDFHLSMSDSTKLRVFNVPGQEKSSRLLHIEKESNITVTGGFLIGDRIERGGTSGGNVLFEIKGGKNVLVEGMHMSYSSSSGLTINSFLFPNDANYFSSSEVVVSKCIFDSNRANNLSITDGHNITVRECESYKAGIDIGNSKGLAPRIGIVVEPVDGQVVQEVYIIDNIEKESAGNGILVAWGDDILITGNRAEKEVGWNGVSNIRIVDNPALNGGIVAGSTGDFELSQSIIGNERIEISRNTITGAPTGIQATNANLLIKDNTIINCTVGIMLRSLIDSEVENNTITSNTNNSFGINAQNFLDRVMIEENTVNLTNGRPFSISGINLTDEQSDYKATFFDNTFECSNSGTFAYCKGIDLLSNRFNGVGFGMTSSQNMLVFNNIINITGGSALGINNFTTTKNIKILKNTLNVDNPNELTFGIKINIVEGGVVIDSDILIEDNIFNLSVNNYGIHSTDFSGVTIEDNMIDNGDSCCVEGIYFEGNDSVITNNSVDKVEITGVNNTIVNNNL